MKTLLLTIIFITGIISTLHSQSRVLNSGDKEIIHNFNSSLHENSINQVYIFQIGLNNNINSDIKGENTSTSSYQKGSYNKIDLVITAKSYQNNLSQIGNRNNIFENIYAPSDNISLNLTQNGHNNYFERFGINSIGDKIEFTMNGNDKTIIVRNFK